MIQSDIIPLKGTLLNCIQWQCTAAASSMVTFQRNLVHLCSLGTIRSPVNFYLPNYDHEYRCVEIILIGINFTRRVTAEVWGDIPVSCISLCYRSHTVLFPTKRYSKSNMVTEFSCWWLGTPTEENILRFTKVRKLHQNHYDPVARKFPGCDSETFFVNEGLQSHWISSLNLWRGPLS